MKRVFFSLCLVLLPITAFCQTDYSGPLRGLWSIKDFLEYEYSSGAHVSTTYVLYKNVEQISFSWKDESMIADGLHVSDRFEKKKYKDTLFYQNSEAVIDYYKNHVKTVLDEVTLFSFVRTATDTCLYLGTHFYDKLFNTLRTDEKERARTVVNELIIPQLYEAYKCFANTDFRVIGVGGVSLNKSFADDSSLAVCDHETVVLFINKDDIRDCVDEFLLTEEELLKKASIYLLSDSGKRKVSLY